MPNRTAANTADSSRSLCQGARQGGNVLNAYQANDRETGFEREFRPREGAKCRRYKSSHNWWPSAGTHRRGSLAPWLTCTRKCGCPSPRRDTAASWRHRTSASTSWGRHAICHSSPPPGSPRTPSRSSPRPWTFSVTPGVDVAQFWREKEALLITSLCRMTFRASRLVTFVWAK